MKSREQPARDVGADVEQDREIAVTDTYMAVAPQGHRSMAPTFMARDP